MEPVGVPDERREDLPRMTKRDKSKLCRAKPAERTPAQREFGPVSPSRDSSRLPERASGEERNGSLNTCLGRAVRRTSAGGTLERCADPTASSSRPGPEACDPPPSPQPATAKHVNKKRAASTQARRRNPRTRAPQRPLPGPLRVASRRASKELTDTRLRRGDREGDAIDRGSTELLDVRARTMGEPVMPHRS